MHKTEDWVTGWFIPAFTAFICLIHIFIWTAMLYPAEAPTRDPLTACQAELQITAQFALQQGRSRSAVEQELARVMAVNALLQARVNELSPKSEKPAK